MAENNNFRFILAGKKLQIHPGVIVCLGTYFHQTLYCGFTTGFTTGLTSSLLRCGSRIAAELTEYTLYLTNPAILASQWMVVLVL